jgi:tetratricopeptide (TPR) repeat protein
MPGKPTFRDLVWLLPVLALALVLVHSSLWLPGARLPWTPLVVAGLGLVWLVADRNLLSGAILALLLMVLCAAFAAPGIHLWGDGALRLRNLEAGIPVQESARFEPGDALLHELAMDLGMSGEGSFAMVGVASGAIYLAGVLLLLGATGGSRRVKAALLVLLLAPAWTVFFTGYVESYALLAGCLALFAGLVRSGRSAIGVSLVAIAGSFAHILGILLAPCALVYSQGRECTTGKVLALAAIAGTVTWHALTMGSGGLPEHGLLYPGPLDRLSIILFSAPVLLVLPFLLSGSPDGTSLLASLMYLCSFVLLPLEKGAARDWDLGSVMLIPVYMLLVSLSVRNRKLLSAVTMAAIILAGPRIASFLDPGISLGRYELSIEMSSDPAALEELAISRRDQGRCGEAADLFARAYQLSGNGRHLSQQAEALRLDGRAGEAVAPATMATELRPDVETAWYQLVLVARDAGDPELAMNTADRHQELFPESPSLWPVALEAAVPEGDPRTAWVCAQRALASEDTLATVLINAGTAAWMNGFTGLAMERYLIAADMDPGSPLPWYNMGMVMFETGDVALTRYYMGRALEADSSFSPAGEVLDLLEGQDPGS